MMVRLLSKLFNIRTHEWPRVSLLFLMTGLGNAGIIWGTTVAYAAFLQQIGLGALPWVLVLSSVLSILAIAIYTAFADCVANDRLLIVLYAIGITNIVLGAALLWLDLSLIAYPIMYLLNLVWVTVFNSHFVTYVNSFYDIQSAKRVLPLVFAGFRVGSIVAGLTMPLLTAWFAPSIIILIWLLTFLVTAGVVWSMQYILREEISHRGQLGHSSPTAASSEEQHLSYLDNMQEGFRYTAQSTYLRWMAIGTLLLMVLLALIEYRSSGLLLEIYGTPEELANFLALLVGVGNIIVLPMLLFGMSRLIARWGLGNVSMIFPAVNLLICGGLIRAPGLGSAIAAYFDRTAFRIAFQYPIDGLLYNAVPLRVKGRARAFVSGLIMPIGVLIGGLLLLLPLASTVWWFVPTLIGILAATYTVSAWFIRQQYSQALVKMLEQEDYSFLLLQEASELTVADPATLTQLQKKLEESASHELTVFIAKLISQVGGSKAVPILGLAARAATDARTRSAIIDVLVAADLRGDAVRQLYSDFLADPDGQVRQSAIAGSEQLAGPMDKQFLSRMQEMVQDPDVDVCVRALSVLVRSGDFYQLTPAVQVLDQLLADEDPHRRAYGVRVLGQIGDERAIRRLVEYLTDPADKVRLEAALAVEALSQSKMSVPVARLVLDHMSPLLQDPIERVRQAALIVLGRMGTHESYQAMINALVDSSSQVAETAVDVLVQVGKSIIPIVYPKLDSPDPQLRKMAAVILSRVNPREFGALVGSSITDNLLSIYRNYGLAEALAPYIGHTSIVVLQSALREQNQQLVEEIFYLLTAIRDPDAVKIVKESLWSENARVRANATEALEALTTPQTASLIAPMFEPEPPPAQLLSLSKDAWDMEQPDVAQAIRQLVTDSDDPWLRTITTFALGEIGAALSSKSLDGSSTAVQVAGPAGRQKGRKARHPRPADLLGRLTDASADTSAQPNERVETPDLPTPSTQRLLTLQEIESMLKVSLVDPVADVRIAARAANRMTAGLRVTDVVQEEETVLSTIERVIFLKEVPFFESMTIDQLKVLANVCEEELFEKDTRLFEQGDPGGTLYVVVNGRVAIEREGRRKGSFVRLATIEAHSYFGEMTLFDKGPRSAAAVAIQDTLALRLRREPLLVLVRRYPDLSMELINVLSQRLRASNDRIAQLTRSMPRELQKLFDQFD